MTQNYIAHTESRAQDYAQSCYILSSRKPLTSNRPVPLVCHSPDTYELSSLVEDRSTRRPPGITIFPALRVLPAAIWAVRGCGNPRALRCRRVSGFCRGSGTGSGGGVGGEGDDRADDDVRDDKPDRDESSERDGVFSSASASASASALMAVLGRLQRFVDPACREIAP